MFCPQCAAENKADQKYCRNCGLSLLAVQLALEGRVDEASAKLEKNLDKIASGILIFGIFAVVALVSVFFSGFSAALNLALGLLIAGPMIYRGIVQLQQSIKLIDINQNPSKQILPASERREINPPSQVAQLSGVPDTNPVPSPTLDSIAEQTTRNLIDN